MERLTLQLRVYVIQGIQYCDLSYQRVFGLQTSLFFTTTTKLLTFTRHSQAMATFELDSHSVMSQNKTKRLTVP